MNGALALFLRGAGVGLAVAAPVGPIGLLCIRRSLAQGRAAGFSSGLGAAVADAAYAAVAAFGLTAATHWIAAQQTWMQPAGGALLLWLGARIFRAALPAAPQAGTASEAGASWGGFASTFALTLTNPLTILSFAAIFAGTGVFNARIAASDAGWLTAGVFSGSALWWLVLSQVTASLRGSVAKRRDGLRWVNRVCGAALAGFGLWQLAAALFSRSASS